MKFSVLAPVALLVACSGDTINVYPAGSTSVGVGGSGGESAAGVGGAGGAEPGSGGGASSTTASVSSSIASTSSSVSSSSSSGTGGQGGSIDPPECVVPQDCPGIDNECRARACDGGKCGVDFKPANSPLVAQTAGDCQTATCDGAGVVSSVVSVADITDDGDSCTLDACTAGAPTSTSMGDEQCHAVCVLPADEPANNSLGEPVGVFGAGAYLTCGLDDLAAAAPPPWEWEYIGVTWKETIALNEYTRTCGDASELAGVGYSPAISMGKTCATGTPCRVAFHYEIPGVSGTTWRHGVCE
jgi:hypothetical protein